MGGTVAATLRIMISSSTADFKSDFKRVIVLLETNKPPLQPFLRRCPLGIAIFVLVFFCRANTCRRSSAFSFISPISGRMWLLNRILYTYIIDSLSTDFFRSIHSSKYWPTVIFLLAVYTPASISFILSSCFFCNSSSVGAPTEQRFPS